MSNLSMLSARVKFNFIEHSTSCFGAASMGLINHHTYYTVQLLGLTRSSRGKVNYKMNNFKAVCKLLPNLEFIIG